MYMYAIQWIIFFFVVQHYGFFCVYPLRYNDILMEEHTPWCFDNIGAASDNEILDRFDNIGAASDGEILDQYPSATVHVHMNRVSPISPFFLSVMVHVHINHVFSIFP